MAKEKGINSGIYLSGALSASLNENTIDNWIETKDRIPTVFAGKYRVRKENGEELNAFFYQDRISWIAFYGKKTSHWWDAKGNHERLDNITHWKEKNMIENQE